MKNIVIVERYKCWVGVRAEFYDVRDVTASCRHAVRKAFDRFPAYVAAKLAGSKKAKQHKYSSRRRAGSPKRLAVSPRGSASTRGIQMTSRSTQDR